jgi:hypothetical protein
MVKTIVCRLREDRVAPKPSDQIGGSTYTLDVWPDHPLEQEAVATLSRLRSALSELRRRIDEFNAEHRSPDGYNQVVVYVGQCVIQQDSRGNDEAS